MKKALIIPLMFSAVVYSQTSFSHHHNEVKVISYDPVHKEIVKTVKKRRFKKNFKKLMGVFQESAEKAMDVDKGRSPKWRLASIEVGPTIGGTIGIGNWYVGGMAGFKVMFERKE